MGGGEKSGRFILLTYLIACLLTSFTCMCFWVEIWRSSLEGDFAQSRLVWFRFEVAAAGTERERERDRERV